MSSPRSPRTSVVALMRPSLPEGFRATLFASARLGVSAGRSPRSVLGVGPWRFSSRGSGGRHDFVTIRWRVDAGT